MRTGQRTEGILRLLETVRSVTVAEFVEESGP